MNQNELKELILLKETLGIDDNISFIDNKDLFMTVYLLKTEYALVRGSYKNEFEPLPEDLFQYINFPVKLQ